MNMYEKLQRAHMTLMTVNDRTDFDLVPVCKLLKEAAEFIEEQGHMRADAYSRGYDDGFDAAMNGDQSEPQR